MNKKALVFLGSILALIVITIGFILFVQFRAKKNNSSQLTSTDASSSSSSSSSSSDQNNPAPAPTPTPTPTPSPTPAVPVPAPGSPVKLTDTAAVSPALSYDGTLLWYFTPDGHLFNVDLQTGQKKEYLLPNNYSVTKAIWPSVGNDFIVQSGSGSGRTFYYYDSQTKKFIAYPANVKAVDFMPDGLHVVYEWVDASNKATLSTANFDLTGHKTVLSLPTADDYVIKAASLRNRAFYYKDNALADGKIYYANLDSGSTFAIKTAASNQVIWSPDSTHFLYNRLDKDGNTASNQLWLGDLDSSTDTALGVDGLPAKGAFDKTGAHLVLALPGSGGNDTLMIADTKTFQANNFFTGTGVSAADLAVANDAGTVYFKNSDGFVYSLPTSK